MAGKKHQLKSGTILDNRFIIHGVLGEGGFGITYDGENQRLGMRVAIKEFFCQDYMERDTGETDVCSVSDPDMEERFQKEKRDFLKEARCLRDFSGEQGVVHVIDYFEINETAYIVMPFLEGVTLREHVRKNGRMDHETIFRKMKPLLGTLAKIHEAGLIHRDISPDNIMLLSDGSLCLIDFGAAYQYDKGTKSYSLIGKNGYAPPEQYRTDVKMLPSTDIYALCATICFCLTGSDPEDSLQRILLDELSMPSELGVSIPSTAEAILRKGLSLRSSDRQQSIPELLSEIEKIYPEPAVSEGGKKRGVLTGLLIAAAAFIIGAGIFYWQQHRVELKFRKVETETIWLTANDELNVQEYTKSAKAVEDRLEAFAGKHNYLWQEKDGGIRIEFPAELLCGKEPLYLCKAYLSRPMNLYLAESKDYDTRRQIANESIPLSRNLIQEAELKEGTVDGLDRKSFHLAEEGDYWYILLRLTDECVQTINERMDHCLDKQNVCLHLYYDIEDNVTQQYYNSCLTVGDGRSLILINHDQYKPIQDLLLHDIRFDGPKKAFTIQENWVVSWEDTATSIIPGKNQCNYDELGSERTLFLYSSNADMETQKGSFLHNFVVMKDRLDTLHIPYACGLMNTRSVEYGESVSIIIAVNDGTLWQSDAILLGTQQAQATILPFKSGVSSDDYYYLYDYSFETKNGKRGLAIDLSDYSREDLQETITKWEQNGVETLYLRQGYELPVVLFSLPQIKEAVDSGFIPFTELYMPETSIEEAEEHGFFDFLNQIYSEDAASAVALQRIRKLGINERPIEYTIFDLPRSIYDVQIRLCDKWQTEWIAPENVSVQKNYDPTVRGSGFEAWITITGMEEKNLPDALHYMDSVYSEEAVRNGLIQDLSIRFDFDSELRLYIGVGEYYSEFVVSAYEGISDLEATQRICQKVKDSIKDYPALQRLLDEGVLSEPHIRLYNNDGTAATGYYGDEQLPG